MKEQRRFSLCPISTTTHKIDPRTLMRNLSYGGGNDFSLTPAGEAQQHEQQQQDDVNSPLSPSTKLELRTFTDQEKDSPSTSEKLAMKEALKVQKKNYQEEKKRAAKELSSALKDPSVVIISSWLKIRGTLKSWARLWCVLKPGLLLIYKTPKADQWVGTALLNACKLIERPSKKDGFCFKLYHPLDKSIWAMKGPEGENVGSITQPLPSSYLIFRAKSESDGRCWMDALELALSCSSLYKLSSKSMCDVELSCVPETCHIFSLLQSAPNSDLSVLNDSMENDLTENECNSDKSEKDNHESDMGGHESDMDQHVAAPPATQYTEQSQEEMAEAGEMSQTETVSEENKGLIWTLLKQLRPGMDLSKVVLPTFILEPRSFLDKISDYYYHADLLSGAVRAESPYARIKHVLRWYLSGFYKKPKGLKKPYNPILGETFRCCWLHPQTNGCTFYIAEQVSHHPPISAFYVSNRKDGFCISGSILAKSKFYGNSLSAILDGKARLLFLERDEEYVITMPYAHCKGILYGTMTMELGGKITVDCKKTKCSAELEFKLKPFLGSSCSVNQISGKICMSDEVVATIDGHWDGEVLIQEKLTGQQEVLWQPSPAVRMQRLRRQVVPVELQGQFESERLWQRVTSAIHGRNQHLATLEKSVLEEAQRKEARERGDAEWSPRLFTLDTGSQEWRYKYAETKPWDSHTCVVQFEKDGIIQTREKQPRQNKARTHRSFRKPSSQTSHNSESSCSTPDLMLESSDNEEFVSCCARCRKETKGITHIEACIASIKQTQCDIQRNLSALRLQVERRSDSEDNATLSARYCLMLCVLLLFQLLINYMST